MQVRWAQSDENVPHSISKSTTHTTYSIHSAYSIVQNSVSFFQTALRAPTSGFWATAFLFAVHIPLFTWLFSYCEDWGGWEAYLFTCVIVSTIGYGNIAPKTDGGKALVILCGITGIPLVLAGLDWLGEFLLWLIVGCLEIVKQRAFGDTSPVSRQLFLFACSSSIALYLMQAILIYHHMEEDWTWLDTVYFVFNMLSTIGLGDFVPTSTGSYNEVPPLTWYHVWHICNATVGLAVLALLIALLQAKAHWGFGSFHKIVKLTASRSNSFLKEFQGPTRLQKYLSLRSQQSKSTPDPIWVTISNAFSAAVANSSLEDLCAELDISGSGCLSEDEFLIVCRSMLHLSLEEAPDERLQDAFQHMDISESGTLELVELVLYLGNRDLPGRGAEKQASNSREGKWHADTDKHKSQSKRPISL